MQVIYKQFIKNKLSYLKNYKSSMLTAIMLIIIADIFFSNTKSDVVVFGILGLYLFSINLYKLKAKTTFLICVFILAAFSILFILTNTSDSTEKAAVWLFLFLSTGIMQELWQLKNEKN